MSTTWYTSWFNTPYYHDLYSNRDYTEAAQFIDTLCANLDIGPGQTAVDMACGKGRHALQLHKNGLTVTGIDLSENSIAAAQELAKPGLTFEVGNMLDPATHPPVDWVFNLFTSFGYFEDDALHQMALNHMATLVKPGGHLVMDYLNGPSVIAGLVPKNEVTTNERTYRITREVSNGHIIKKIAFEDEGTPYAFEERVRAFSAHELTQMIEKTGMIVQRICGDYSLNSYHENSSKRLIIIASKP